MNYITYAGLTTSAKKENKATIKHLFDCVTEVTEVTEEAIRSTKRHRELVDARKIITIFCVRSLGMKTVATGRLINRDHASVCHYTNDVESLFKFDKQLKAKYDAVLKMMHSKQLITHGAETVKSYLLKLEADKEIEAIKNRVYEF